MKLYSFEFLFFIALIFISSASLSSEKHFSWGEKNGYEIYFKGSFGVCEERELLSVNRNSIGPELLGLKEYYQYLVKDDHEEVIARYSNVDGSRERMQIEWEQDAEKFSAFTELTSVKAKCSNIWGRYRFYDVVWESDYTWLDVEFCSDNGKCMLSDFFLTVDDSSQLHSVILSNYYQNVSVSEKIRNNNKFELKFYPPFGAKERELSVFVNLKLDVQKSVINSVQSYLSGIGSLVNYLERNVEISLESKQSFGIKKDYSKEDVESLLLELFPEGSSYRSYKSDRALFAVNPRKEFVSKLAIGKFSVVGSIALTTQSQLVILKSDTDIIFMELSSLADEGKVYNFNFSDRSYAGLIYNKLFANKLIQIMKQHNRDL